MAERIVRRANRSSREIEESGALRVRPDKHIGWRSATLPDDPESALREALSRLLGRA